MGRKLASGNTIVLLLVIFLLAGSLFYNYRILSEKMSLEQERDEYASRAARLEEEIARIGTAVPPEPDWKKTATRSFPNPKEQLIEDLLAREDLLPWEGVLGGTMKIYRRDDIWFIGPSWCMAYAEDGHIGGYILLSYGLEGEQIVWNLIDKAPLQ